MPHALKVLFASGVMSVELDGAPITTVKAVVLSSAGVSIKCNITTDALGVDLTSQEGEIEFAIPDSLADALK